MASSAPFGKGAESDVARSHERLAQHASPGAIRFYATIWCGDCRRARRIFAELGVPYQYIDIEEDDDAAALVMRLNEGMRRVPTIIFPDGTLLAEPSNAALEAKLAPYAR